MKSVQCRGTATAAFVFLWLCCAAFDAQAQNVRLRVVDTDDDGVFSVLFSIFDGSDNPEPIIDLPDPSQISMRAGELEGALSELALSEVSIAHLASLDIPFRIVVLVPNTALFTGLCVTPSDCESDVTALRAALVSALSTLPNTANITVQIGFYNDHVVWAEYRMDELAELEDALLGQEYQDHESVIEDLFGAIDVALRQTLRRPAVESRPVRDAVTFFVPITSGLLPLRPDRAAEVVEQYRDLLADPTVLNGVVTIPIIYDPIGFFDMWAEDSMGRIAGGLAPDNSVFRMATSASEVRVVLNQTIDEIAHAAVLRFRNDELPPNIRYLFQLSLTQDGVATDSKLVHGLVTRPVAPSDLAAPPTPAPSDEELEQAIAVLRAATISDPFDEVLALAGADQPVAFWGVQAEEAIPIPVGGPLPEALLSQLIQIRDNPDASPGWALGRGAPLNGERKVIFGYLPAENCIHVIEFAFAQVGTVSLLRQIVAYTECD